MPRQLPNLAFGFLLALAVTNGAAAQVAQASATVVRVVDGDTVDVQMQDAGVERIRLIGIDTPEVVDPRKPVQCFGREASAHAHELLDGQSVALELDPSQGELAIKPERDLARAHRRYQRLPKTDLLSGYS